ncbi:SEC-C metal-binding domain-containing protein [Paenibacillus sp. FSL R5-0912]|uniref:SEC-C metal-binding domain-containing protein n=1 Tax=Paenibacillus sp. FSL R5-0912 TaxID=1536771 RepID=UPI0004F77C7F|nr:SEC-C metal-binding domain-containing protein [Paenibacillus sp. FSL R5-0912]AIQ43340.1 hypothetical protein R50912_27455 [Paenibacillus sp. FSL R5-0912]
MFTTEQVKGFILHPEPIVSNTALQYFADSFLYENDTTLMPLVLERMKQSGDAGTVHLPHTYKFPLTEEVIRELLALYQSPTIDKNTKFHLQIILRHCSPEQSIPFMELVEQDPSWQKLLVQKSNLANLDDQELLDVFKVFIEQSTGKSWGEFDTAYGDEIVNELSRRRCMDTEAVLQRLRDNDPHDPSYEVPYLIQLAGLMKLEAAILVLCGFFGSQDDLLLENAKEALVRIGTAGVVTTLTEQYSIAEGESYRLYASGVFGKIKLPDSEEAVLRLLPGERDLTNATILAEGLCELGSNNGLPIVQAMLEGDYDRGLLNLTESIYAYCVISDTLHPSLQDWKKQLDQEEARLAKRKAEADRMFRTKAPIGTYNRLNGTEKTYISPEKVGRNDPCPCGSGKKHKKCCGA